MPSSSATPRTSSEHPAGAPRLPIPGLSRRGFIGATALAAFGITFGEFLTGIDVRSAAASTSSIAWGYPLPARVGTSRGFLPSVPHFGIDYLPGAGTPVHAVADGVIEFTGWDDLYGQHVILRHADGFFSVSAHMQRGSQLAAPRGADVSRGDVLGRVGATGRATGPHLHVELRRGSLAYPAACVDPAPYLTGAPLPGTTAQKGLSDVFLATRDSKSWLIVPLGAENWAIQLAPEDVTSGFASVDFRSDASWGVFKSTIMNANTLP